jgi:predicted Ser/Thr protein kinase
MCDKLLKDESKLNISIDMNDLSKHEVSEIIDGGTSVNKILKDKNNTLYFYKCMKNVDVKYNKIKKNVDFIETFNNEISALKTLGKYKHFPILYNYNDSEKTFLISYCGISIYQNKKEIPNDWKDQLLNIYNILEAESLYHNDIFESNFCLLNNTIYLIDFGQACNEIKYPYFNLSIKLIKESDSIEDLSSKIREIGLAVIGSLYIRDKKFFNE